MPDHRVASPVPACEWAAHLLELATRADAMGPDAPLADRLQLATDAFASLWLGWSPSTIARSCRASARLLEPVLVVAGSLDEQLLANSAARERGLVAAHLLTKPAEIAPVVPIDDERRKGSKGTNQHTRKPQNGASSTGSVRDQVAAAMMPADLSHLSEAEFLALCPQGHHAVGDEPAPAPQPRRQPSVRNQRPDGWMTPGEAATAAGVSASLVRKALRAGAVPAELTLRASYRNQWVSPAALQFFRIKKTAGPELPGGLMTGETPETPMSAYGAQSLA